MKFETFLQSVAHKKMPEGLPLPLQSLWYDATGDWIMAHKIVDGPDGLVFARVHAYLHRKEGDLWNADYWYRKSSETRPEMTLKEEWEILVKRML